jgi:hypothetical protein
VAERYSPERTRRATYVERKTVQRLSWETLVRLHRWLEFLGRVATVVWVGFIATFAFGVDWKSVTESALNSGKPVKGAIVLVIVLWTLLFVAVRSVLGYARWRIQRELWRRDVAGAER